MNNTEFKKKFIWNIVGTSFNAFNSLFFLIIVTRIQGLNDAGIFTLAFSTACILYVIGTYSGRIYQVTENNKNITDNDYIVNRIISCIIMMIITLVFVAIKKYELYKASIFLILAGYKCLEAFSDVLYGIMQKNEQLDKVGKSYFAKSLLSLLIFILIEKITKNLAFSSIAIVAVYVIIMIIYDLPTISKYYNKKIDKNNVLLIFRNGFFIFAVTFLSMYLLNAPKFAIDNFLTEDIQAIFGIIIMPATVMGLVGQFLLHPYLTEFNRLTKEKNIKNENKLRKLVLKIVLYIIAFGLVSALMAYLLGIPVLNLLYGIKIGNYQIQLVTIIIAATLYNIGVIYSALLTTLRRTFIQFIIYLVSSVFILISSNLLTAKEGMNGAIFSYFLTMFIIFMLYIIISNITLKNVFNNEKNNSLVR